LIITMHFYSQLRLDIRVPRSSEKSLGSWSAFGITWEERYGTR
jgi:hypothetical protein